MSKYTVEYTQLDYGTERLLTVRCNGEIIGQRDPFADGIPVDPKRRSARLKKVAREIIAENEQRLVMA